MLTEQEIKIRDEILDKYSAIQTEQFSEERIRNIVHFIWKDMGYSAPEVVVCRSPVECDERAEKEDPENEYQPYWNIWLTSYAATYEFAKALGQQFPEEKYEEFVEWAKCCPFILFSDNRVYVSLRPIELHMDEQRRLHNPDGPAVLYADGWAIYAMNGVHLDEQIIMHPETQTIDQIRKEQNEEVKRIRIERYGWEKFLNGINAVLVDERQNDIEGTKEFLFRSTTDNITALMCICPSTAKEFILEVDNSCNDCVSAQSWLSGGLSDRITHAS